MPHVPRLRAISARLLTGVGGEHAVYRLLTVGPAVLRPPADASAPWLVRVTRDGTCLPLACRRGSIAGCRVAAALLEPHDLRRVGHGLRRLLSAEHDAGPWLEFHGWALLYQRAGDVGIGRVDRDEDGGDLPAFYESPLEISDRQAYLVRRGVPCRAMALLTQPGDVDDHVRPAKKPSRRSS